MVPAETFSRETSELNPWYVTGFTEGEGSFTFSRSGRSINLYFAIKLTMADRSVLEAIQDSLGGIGRIYDVKARAPVGPGSGYTKSAAYFRASRRSDLYRVIDHFDRYPLRGSKALSYLIWREMFSLKAAFRRPPARDLEALAARLTASSPRNTPWSR